jgi:transcriptional regulator with XRE-family HTH domain
MTRKELARAINELRRVKGWTQVELAERVGVTGATISRWEATLALPQPEHVSMLRRLGLPAGADDIEDERLLRTMGSAVLGAWRVSLRGDGALVIQQKED